MDKFLFLGAVAVPLWSAGLAAAFEPPCPQVTTQPVSLRICPSAAPTLSIHAVGGEPLSYQWQSLRQNGTWIDIAEDADILGSTDVAGVFEFWAHSDGSTTPQIQLSGISHAAGSGPLSGQVSLRCISTGSCGAAVSNEATIRICRVDANCDTVFTPADIASFVNVWHTSVQHGTLAGDYDWSGDVVPADIAGFVSAWFAAVSTGNC